MVTKKKGTKKPPVQKEKAPAPLQFTEPQRVLILTWIAEGLTLTEMNERAAKERTPFILTPSEVHYWRASREVDIAVMRKMRESEIINTGFALRERRVEALNSLSMKIFNELHAEKGSKLWLSLVKGIGSGADYEKIKYEEFNKAEVDTLRNLLDDIASEVGGRVRRTDITTKDRPIAVSSLDPSQWENLSNDELAVLERAAEILERASSTNDST